MNRWKNPEDALPEATLVEIEHYRDTQCYESALHLCISVVQNAPNDYTALYELAQTYIDVKNFECAVSTFDTILTLPKDEYKIHEVLLHKGIAQHRNKSFEQAATTFETALTYNESENIDTLTQGYIYYLLSATYIDLGPTRIEDALVAIDKALACEHDPEYYCIRGNILDDKGEHEASIKCYTKAIELNPANPKYFYNRGYVLNEIDPNTALLDFEEALRLCPENADAWCMKGDALEKLQRFEEAMIAYDKAAELDPDDSITYNNKGNALNNWKKYEQAIQVLNKAIELAPQVENSYCHKGFAYYQLGNLELAEQLYKKALELKPDYELALERLTELQMSTLNV